MKARIHSLNGEFDEVTMVKEPEQNTPYFIFKYRGIYCTGIFNPFAGCFYVDDKYGLIDFKGKPFEEN